MKKTIVTGCLFFIGISTIIASPEVEKGAEEKKKDSTEVVKESTFKTNYTSDQNRLIVEISGNSDSLATLTITDSRGGSILFSLVDQQDQEIEFDLSTLEKGMYNVMYITNKEIRIKKLIIQ